MPDHELLPTPAARPVDPRHEVDDAVEQAWERLVADLRDGVARLACPGWSRKGPRRNSTSPPRPPSTVARPSSLGICSWRGCTNVPTT